MQIYVHLGGKNYGPYSIEQIRQYVQAGNFTVDQQACYDGKNWIRISDLPGYAVTEKPKPQVKSYVPFSKYYQNLNIRCE